MGFCGLFFFSFSKVEGRAGQGSAFSFQVLRQARLFILRYIDPVNDWRDGCNNKERFYGDLI